MIDALAMTAAWIVLVCLVDPIGDFPINDDWVYGAAVKTLVETGRFELYSFSSANVGPQVWFGALFTLPFGFSFTALRFSTLVLGLVGVLGTYILFREVWNDRVGAIVLAVAVMVNPIYFSQANTFMTDVPFFAVIVASMALIAAGYQRDRPALLAAGVATVVLGVLLRQFTIIVLVGFALAHLVSGRPTMKRVVIAVGPLIAALVLNVLFTRWMADTGRKPAGAGIPSLVPSFDMHFVWYGKATLFSALGYAGLFLIPSVAVYFPTADRLLRRGGRRRGALIAIAALAALIGYAFIARGLTVPTGENILTYFGIGPLTNGDTLMHNENMPRQSMGLRVGWKVVTALAVIASACLLVAASSGAWTVVRAFVRPSRRIERKPLRLVAFFGGCAASYAGILMLLSNGYTVLDRYMLPLMIFGALMLPTLQRDAGRAQVSTRRRSLIAGLLLVVSAVFSVVATHDFLRWSAVRWDALQALRAEGVSPHDIDGGYEFDGWYLYDRGYVATPTRNWWWVDRDEYLAASGPVSGYHVYRRYPVERWWNNGAGDVVILKR